MKIFHMRAFYGTTKYRIEWLRNSLDMSWISYQFEIVQCCHMATLHFSEWVDTYRPEPRKYPQNREVTLGRFGLFLYVQSPWPELVALQGQKYFSVPLNPTGSLAVSKSKVCVCFYALNMPQCVFSSNLAQHQHPKLLQTHIFNRSLIIITIITWNNLYKCIHLLYLLNDEITLNVSFGRLVIFFSCVCLCMEDKAW